MRVNTLAPKISVLLIFNLDPIWSMLEQDEFMNTVTQLERAIVAAGYKTTLVPVTSSNMDLILAEYDPFKHIVFNWCDGLPQVRHSEYLVVEYLEHLGFTFTGASSLALALNQDKCRTKQLLDKSQILTPNWQIFNRDTPVNWDCFPAIVKPSLEHCSEGIDRNAVCTNQAELNGRINYIIDRFQQPVVVEEFIDGRELHVSVWGNGIIDILPPVEMGFSLFADHYDRICSYESKFVPGSKHYQSISTILPAPLREDELCNVEKICKSVYTITGCRDYARIDLRLKDGAIYVLDVNPNSDISIDTSTVLSANFKGYSYGEFVDCIVRLAAQRHPIWGKEFSCVGAVTTL